MEQFSHLQPSLTIMQEVSFLLSSIAGDGMLFTTHARGILAFDYPSKGGTIAIGHNGVLILVLCQC